MDKKPFYLFKRKLKSGKKIYYWYTYDKNGERTVPQSTGYSNKNEAFNFCYSKLLKTGSIKSKELLFEEFSKDWFTEGHEYTVYKKQKSSTLKVSRSKLVKVINPFFKKFKLSVIDEKDILNFIQTLQSNGYSEMYIHNVYITLKVMFNYAVYKEYIPKSPIPKYMSLKSNPHRIAFSLDELKYIFNQEWNDKKVRLICLLGACTGMRLSEILGLQEEQLMPGYINIDRQCYFGNMQTTKTGAKRFVTVPKRLEDALMTVKGSCFIFEIISRKRISMKNNDIYNEFYSHYSEEMLVKRKENSLTFHSLRHFFNTYLMSNDIQQAKVDFIVGHSAGIGSMNRLYTTWKPEMYSDVLELQEKLLDELGI